jgi:hypothetical protein
LSEGSRVVSGRVGASGTLADFAGHSIVHSAQTSLERPGSAFRLLLHLSVTRESGILGITTEDETIALSLSGGHILKTSSDAEDEDESLAITLLEQELLPRDRLVRVAEHVDKSGDTLARSLFAMQVMSAREMVKAYKAMHTRHVFAAVSTKEASFTFARGDVLAGKRIESGPTHIRIRRGLNEYLRQQVRLSDANDLESMLQPLRMWYLRIPPAVIAAAAAVGFSKRDAHMMENLMDGSHQLDHIVHKSVMSDKAANQAIFAMATLGFVELLAESTNPIVIISPAQRLEARLAELQAANHFDRLASHWSTPLGAIAIAYTRRSAEYGSNGKHGADRATAPLAREISALLDASWDAIQDLQKRQAYRATLVDAEQMRFSADLLIGQARTAELQRRFEEARELYQTSHELHPNSKTARILAVLDEREAEWRKRLREKEKTEREQ